MVGLDKAIRLSLQPLTAYKSQEITAHIYMLTTRDIIQPQPTKQMMMTECVWRSVSDNNTLHILGSPLNYLGYIYVQSVWCMNIFILIRR